MRQQEKEKRIGEIVGVLKQHQQQSLASPSLSTEDGRVEDGLAQADVETKSRKHIQSKKNKGIELSDIVTTLQQIGLEVKAKKSIGRPRKATGKRAQQKRKGTSAKDKDNFQDEYETV
jgi:hypothetical protein